MNANENRGTAVSQKYLPVIQRLALLFFTAAALTLTMTSLAPDRIEIKNFHQGEVARYSIRATKDFLLEDADSTEREREGAAQATKRIFIKDDRDENTAGFLLKEFFDTLEKSATSFSASTINLSLNAKSELGKRFHLELTPEEWTLLSKRGNWQSLDRNLNDLVSPILERGIVSNKRLLQNAIQQHGAVLRFRGSKGEQSILSSREFFDLREALQAFERTLPMRGFGSGPVYDSVIKKLGTSLIRPNIIFDVASTEDAMRQARTAVNPIFYHMRQGEVVVRAGDVISGLQEQKLARMQELQGTRSEWKSGIGYTLLTVLSLLLIYAFMASLSRKFKPTDRDLLLLSMTLVGSFLLIKLFSILGSSLNFSFPDVDSTSLLLATPLAAGGLVLQVTLGGFNALYYILSFGLLTGLFLEESWMLLLTVVMGNIIGALSLRDCPRRSAFLISGAQVAVINMLIVLCFMLIFPQYGLSMHAFRVLCAAFGGLLSGVVAAGLAPVAEYIGGYVTDIKLLELASLDRPLLRDLSLQAPGTWNHSMVIGQMCEVAAEGIGANGLLARVGAYYHDIGKLKKPVYFVENQLDQVNRHDKLPPSMSALIIKSHVKEGMELAHQHKLPMEIQSFIPQHHGTSLIEYFYDKALSEAGEGETVDESLYRYPGPKPQTKEAGILMLADAIEASSRTLQDPTPARIQGLVQKMINRVFAGGQLDESELTLRDLHSIAKSFTRVLSGIYHRRIEYHDPAERLREQQEQRELKEQALAAAASPSPQTETENATAATGSAPTAGAASAETGGEKPAAEKPARKGNHGESEETLKRLGIH